MNSRPFTFLILVVFTLSIRIPSAETQPEALSQRLKERMESSPVAEAIRREVLTGIAFYPDEVIEAILGVAQDPEALFTGRSSSSPDYQEGYAVLSSIPLILEDMKTHPLVTALLGRMAARDPEGVWTTIDEIRSDYRKRVGVPVSEAAAAPVAPPDTVYAPEGSAPAGSAVPTSIVIAPNIAVVESTTPTSEDVYTGSSGVANVGVTYVESTPTSAQGGVAYGTAQGENASAAGYGVAVAGENGAHVGGAGVVVTEDGQVHAGSAGGTVVQTPYGTVATGHAGQTHVDTQNQTFNSSHTAGAVNSQGQGVVAHQEGSGSYDADSFQRAGQGTVQATNGQGAEWTHSGSGQVTETGAAHQSSSHVETNSGQSADIEHSASVEKTETGVDVDHGGSVTTGSGESYEWGNREDSASSKAAPSQDGSRRAESARNSARSSAAPRSAQGFQQGSGGNPLAAIQQDAWKALNQGTRDMQRSMKQAQGQFARSAGKMKSPEAFSGKGLNPRDLSTALDRGMKQQKRSFGGAESQLARGGSGMRPPQPGGRGGGMKSAPRGGGGPRPGAGGGGGRAGSGGGRRGR